MINRDNWTLINKYLEYRRKVDQMSEKTIRLETTWLNHVLEWADETGFEKAPMIRTTFPAYLKTARKDGKEQPYSREYARKVVGCAKRFFEWLTVHQVGFRSRLSQVWIDSLKPPRITPVPSKHESVTIEEIRKIANAPTITKREERIKAAAVFWFLSGIRIGAFVTLPIKAIDIENLEIKQWPSLGVKTKFNKHQTTYMLNIPDLLDVVLKWDQQVRDVLKPDGLWFAPLSPLTCKIDQYNYNIGKYRDDRARKDLKEWMERIRYEYHSPHKFRRGYAIYSTALSRNSKDMKAISQNMMHSSIATTERYIDLPEKELKEKILGLASEELAKNSNLDSIVDQVADKVTEKLLKEIGNLKQK